MKTQTLGRQIRLWTILLVTVPCLLVMGIYTVGQIKVVTEKNLEMISQRVHSQERLIDYWMMERADDVRKISQLKAFRTLDEQQMRYILSLTQQGNKDFDSLSYIDNKGFFKITTLNREIKHQSVVGQPYFQAAQGGNEYISDVVIGRNSGLPIINFSSPVYDEVGEVQGLILGSVRTTKLGELLRGNWIGKTGEVNLVNSQGIILTEPRYLNVLIDKGIVKDTAIMKLKLSEDALHKVPLGETGTGTWINNIGEKVMGAYQYMPERGWTLIGNISEAEILNPIYQQLGMMATGTLVVLLLIMPLAALVTDRIKEPLDWLIEQSNLVIREEYEKISYEKHSARIPHELSVLCETFLTMSQKIQNTLKILRENEVKLENKVRERTVALEREIEEHQAANANLLCLNENLQRISLSDGLTGIANRRYFDEFLEREWERAKRDKKTIALLMVDIDFFKSYNDTYGHIAGDACLKLLAKGLEAMPKRSIDIVARYGGEEFVVVLPDTNQLGAAVVGEKVRCAVEELNIEHKGSSISERVTVSVGIAVMMPDYDAIPATIIAAADAALYQSKRQGRNRVHLATCDTIESI